MGSFSTKYSYNPEIFGDFSEFLENLYMRSSENSSSYSSKYIRKYIESLEDYVYCSIQLNYVNDTNREFFLKQIKSIKNLSIDDDMDCLGNYDGETIKLNTKVFPNKKYNSDERREITFFHELGHVIHGMWSDDYLNYSKYLETNKNSKDFYNSFPAEYKVLPGEGISMLGEAIVQDTAERFECFLNDKKRPTIERHCDKDIFSKYSYYSNFDSYPEFQYPAYKFCRIYFEPGLIDMCSEDYLFSCLARDSFKEDFVKNLDNKLNDSSKSEKDFVLVMSYMGGIKDAVYARNGLNYCKDSVRNSFKYLKNMGDVCDNLFDTLKESTTKTYCKSR